MIASLAVGIAIDRKLIGKSLRGILVHGHHGEFVQCVSPNIFSGGKLQGWVLENEKTF
ncbi:hypothetical protein H6F32_04550 [Anabaena sp. FACHB-1237]|uniref:hypothetical protein n=1 Tax=Anabaena sp. FACHB-1237 TaxID=2692769 RepID=UPI001681575B|nr:hypothetical protein [Anabaena sp. FACHB-1237]MBD2136875.1 hypothetical protein [Anabaena sp. FACHB-1237]